MARRRLLSKYEPSTRMDATKAAALEESLRRAERYVYDSQEVLHARMSY